MLDLDLSLLVLTVSQHPGDNCAFSRRGAYRDYYDNKISSAIYTIFAVCNVHLISTTYTIANSSNNNGVINDYDHDGGNDRDYDNRRRRRSSRFYLYRSLSCPLHRTSFRKTIRGIVNGKPSLHTNSFRQCRCWPHRYCRASYGVVIL